MTDRMEKLEKEFFDAYGIGKPVIKKWSYEGYYEDYSWCSRLENCSKILERNNWTIEDLDKKIQEIKDEAYEKYKKDEDDDTYDRYTDSVMTRDLGRISGAFMQYPRITDAMYLRLICLLHEKPVITLVQRNIKKLKAEVLHIFITWKEDEQFQRSVKSLFSGKNLAEERGGW